MSNYSYFLTKSSKIISPIQGGGEKGGNSEKYTPLYSRIYLGKSRVFARKGPLLMVLYCVDASRGD